MNPISFTVPGVPVPKGRARVGRNRRTRKAQAYTPDRTKQYEANVAAWALIARREANAKMLTGPVGVHISMHPDRAEIAVRELYGKARTSGADIDNAAKALLDGMQGVLFENDRQIEQLTIVLVK